MKKNKQMKKIKKLTLTGTFEELQHLNPAEQKLIIGGDGYSGGGSYSGPTYCVATPSEGINPTSYYKTRSAAESDFIAGSNGWWCCNCAIALEIWGVKFV